MAVFDIKFVKREVSSRQINVLHSEAAWENSTIHLYLVTISIYGIFSGGGVGGGIQ